MKLPNYLRINKVDYPEESKEVIDRLAGTVNPGFDSLYSLANNRISLRDNLACVVKDVTLTVGSTGTPTTPSGIALGDIVQSVIGASVIFAQNQTTSTVYPTSQPFISFTQNGKTFEINNVTGLPANNQFLLRVVVWGS